MLSPSKIIEINNERLKIINSPYNPITGEGSFSVKRTHVRCGDFPLKEMWLPDDFLSTGFCQVILSLGQRRYIENILHLEYNERTANMLYVEFCVQRFGYDFEFWAYTTAKISPKGGGEDISFQLNRAQRTYLKKLEELRTSNRPINIILLKARQWGGSTLTQIYMLWIQIVHRKNWNSVICGDVESQSNIVCGMLSKVVKNYPAWAAHGVKIETKPFEGSSKTRQIEYCQCLYSVGSAQKPDNLRSQNISMAHLTEVGLWKETNGKKPEDLVQSIFGSINDGPYTVKVLESTAKGVGNYFHRTWLRAVKGENDFTPVFIPWFLIDMYSTRLTKIEYRPFIESMNEYEMYLFELGATLEAIAWYRKKKVAMEEEWRMCSEYPSDPKEAFQSTGRPYFPRKYVDQCRKTCMEPAFYGEFVGETPKGERAFENLHFVEMKRKKDSKDNILNVWFLPDKDAHLYRYRYVVSVDIGGTGEKSDPSSIKVFDRMPMIEGGVPEVVAEWHGHIEHDMLIWKAAQIAYAYGKALLVVESNTLETEGTEGDNFEYVLDEIKDFYPDLYSRTSAEQIKEGAPVKYGFHTNPSTKPMVLNFMKSAMRDSLYIERSLETTFEYDQFEIKEDGKKTGAVEGCHDDRVMSTSIGLYVCYKTPKPYRIAQKNTGLQKRKTRIVSEASI